MARLASMRNMGSLKTMFDDGRFERSLVEEAHSAGLSPRPSSSSGGAILRQRTSRAITRDPMESELKAGWFGGGGVRLHPPHLDDSLLFLAIAFIIHREDGTATGGAAGAAAKLSRQLQTKAKAERERRQAATTAYKGRPSPS